MAKKKRPQQKNRPNGQNRHPKSGDVSGVPTAPAARKGGTGFYLVLGLVAVAGIGALWYASRGGAPANLPLSVADMEAEASGAAGVSMGPDDAPVTIIEFEDFQCPSCRNFNSMTGRLIRQNYATGDDAIVRWISYDFPVLGQGSWPPALAARCAGAQGRYWEMHDLLYARTEEWQGRPNPNGTFIDLADEIGLDEGQFRTCLEQRTYLQAVAAARNYGESLGVGGTPTLYLNGRPVPHTPRNASYEGMEQLVLEAAEQARAAEAADTAAGDDGATGG